jgi:hypothetical protein
MVEAHWTAIGAFWLGISAAVIAFSAALINYYFFRSQIDPLVVVYATSDESRPSIINLVIENIGKGLAKDVSFKLSRPIPQKAFGHTNPPIPQSMTSGPLISGIPALGPGAKRVVTWGQYPGLYKGLGDDVVKVTVQFRGDPFGVFDPVWHEVVCPLDVKSFAGTDASDRNWEKHSARELRRIAEVLRRAASGAAPLRVELSQHVVAHYGDEEDEVEAGPEAESEQRRV